jgi:hypothetical protein
MRRQELIRIFPPPAVKMSQKLFSNYYITYDFYAQFIGFERGRFLSSKPGANVIKLFTNFRTKLNRFVPGKLFKPHPTNIVT